MFKLWQSLKNWRPRLADRRRAPRYRVRHQAGLALESGTHSAVVRDVSQSGVRLVCSQRLETETLARLSLYFQGESLDRQVEVVRCAPEPYGGWEVGLRFLPQERCEAMRRYLDFARWLSGHLSMAS
ncbi:MAG TPA: PilZ domain-containing protein [Candidatus Nitrosotenuis sp.]|jgi:hypothetical protein|nr:PilZ domain-containing protein [Candidatus Nitrosotenuis sp.]